MKSCQETTVQVLSEPNLQLEEVPSKPGDSQRQKQDRQEDPDPEPSEPDRTCCRQIGGFWSHLSRVGPGLTHLWSGTWHPAGGSDGSWRVLPAQVRAAAAPASSGPEMETKPFNPVGHRVTSAGAGWLTWTNQIRVFDAPVQVHSGASYSRDNWNSSW